jgi:hypothetical protein
LLALDSELDEWVEDVVEEFDEGAVVDEAADELINVLSNDGIAGTVLELVDDVEDESFASCEVGVGCEARAENFEKVEDRFGPSLCVV